MQNNHEKRLDPRFTGLVYGLRKNNRMYALSIEAAEELSRNDHMSAQYSAEMWEEFWRELNLEWYHSQGLDAHQDSV
jgi:hypothetical protein